MKIKPLHIAIFITALLFISIVVNAQGKATKRPQAAKRCTDLCPNLDIPCITAQCKPYCDNACLLPNGEIDYICHDECYNN